MPASPPPHGQPSRSSTSCSRAWAAVISTSSAPITRSAAILTSGASSGWPMISFTIVRRCRAGIATTRMPSPSSCRIGNDESDGKPVMALAADGLNGGGTHALLGGHEVEHAPHTDDVRIAARCFGDFPIADHIVDDDLAATPRQLERPFEVIGVTGLVGIDEDQIERRFADESWQGLESPPKPQVDDIAKP